MDVDMTHYLFAYGTLRLSNRVDIAQQLAQKSQLVGLGYVKGVALYDIKGFPALVKTDRPEDIVVGDVFLLEDSSLIQELDEYEGIGVGEPPYDYERRSVDVIIGEEELSCMTYCYVSPLRESPIRVESGDYLNP